MKYLCLIFFDETRLDTLTEPEARALIREAAQFNETLREGGHFLAAQPLQPTRAATTLRMNRGRMTVTNGPFVETHEQIGGFILIEARDLDEALQLAARIPVARLGGVEVRPIMEAPAHLLEDTRGNAPARSLA
ncbi:MAG TPA: YciI family protein [Geothrix sp.]|nr:YciI family protein [Geothrix sp.]